MEANYGTSAVNLHMLLKKKKKKIEGKKDEIIWDDIASPSLILTEVNSDTK